MNYTLSRLIHISFICRSSTNVVKTKKEKESSDDDLKTQLVSTTPALAVEAEPSSVTPLTLPPAKPLKEPSLNLTFPAKGQGHELKILIQPEDQHRARYMTEGSRGAIKDKSQQGHPMVKVSALLYRTVGYFI